MKVVVTTWGSLGDLNPYLAIAQGLRARGHQATLAAGECYRERIDALGLDFKPVRPDCAWVTDPAALRRVAHPRWGLIRAVRIPLGCLRESYEDLSRAVEGADLLVASLAMYAARLVAEKRGMPWVSAIHIPTGLFSGHDPPLLPGFPGVSRRLRFLGPAFWGPFGRLLNRAMSPLAKPLYRFRRELGLTPGTEDNPLTEGHSPTLHLALFSRWIADRQPDWPSQTVLTGFPWYEGDAGRGLSPELSLFLDAGPAPLVFTLGTAVAADGGPFYENSARAAELLGRRAVLILTNPRNRIENLPPNIAAFEYEPFAALFPRAAAIVHHGGIGTTGLALKAGRPTLFMPCAWDQPDNAERAIRLGVARKVLPRSYSPARVASELRILLEDPSYARRAAEIGRTIAQEDGVRVACEALENHHHFQG